MLPPSSSKYRQEFAVPRSLPPDAALNALVLERAAYHDLAPKAVRSAALEEQQATDLHPTWPLDELITVLATPGVPRFADRIRSQS